MQNHFTNSLMSCFVTLTRPYSKHIPGLRCYAIMLLTELNWTNWSSSWHFSNSRYFMNTTLTCFGNRKLAENAPWSTKVRLPVQKLSTATGFPSRGKTKLQEKNSNILVVSIVLLVNATKHTVVIVNCVIWITEVNQSQLDKILVMITKRQILVCVSCICLLKLCHFQMDYVFDFSDPDLLSTLFSSSGSRGIPRPVERYSPTSMS